MSNITQKKILVVDDQPNWRELLTDILQNDDYCVITASSFIEAKNLLLSNQKFDLALFDMRLVDSEVYNIQGMKLLEFAKHTKPPITAIILTGYPNPEQERRAREYYGADDYISKVPNGDPFDIDKFSKKIKDIFMVGE